VFFRNVKSQDQGQSHDYRKRLKKLEKLGEATRWWLCWPYPPVTSAPNLPQLSPAAQYHHMRWHVSQSWVLYREREYNWPRALSTSPRTTCKKAKVDTCHGAAYMNTAELYNLGNGSWLAWTRGVRELIFRANSLPFQWLHSHFHPIPIPIRQIYRNFSAGSMLHQSVINQQC